MYLSRLTKVVLEEMDLRDGCESCCRKSYNWLVTLEHPVGPLETEMEGAGRGRSRLGSLGSTLLTVEGPLETEMEGALLTVEKRVV